MNDASGVSSGLLISILGAQNTKLQLRVYRKLELQKSNPQA